MKGLLLKDLYVLTRQMRIFLLMVLVFAVLPDLNTTVFAVVYAAMMPYTALAYDERSKWDQLAGTMPYAVRDIVLSKYVLGWLFMGAAGAVALAAGAIERQFLDHTAGAPLAIALSFCSGLIVMAITLPPMFRFGVERGRMALLFIIIAIVCGSAGVISNLTSSPDAAALLSLLEVVLPAAAAALTLISIPLAVRLYQKRS